MKKPFLIIMAMREEARPLIERLAFKPVENVFGPQMPTLGYETVLSGGRKIHLLLNGVHEPTGVDHIGTQMASVTALLGIRKFSPALVCSMGTCGGKPGGKGNVGDVFLCSGRVWFHTKRIPLAGWDEYAKGGFLCPDVAALAARLGLKTGTLSTTDSVDHPAFDAERFNALGADIADMEGAAVAWMASLYALPFYGLKAVSNYLNPAGDMLDEFYENLPRVTAKLTDRAAALITELDKTF